MIRCYKNVAFALLVLGCASCGEEPKRNTPANDISNVVGNVTGKLRLRLLLEQDTVHPNMPVRIAFFFVNGAADTSIVISPNLLRFQVIGPGGRRVPVLPDPSLNDRHFATSTMSLPHQMFVGAVVDLRCIQMSNIGDAQPANKEACAWQHQIVEGGLYQVISMYSTPADPRIQKPLQGRDYVRLVSDTVQFFLKVQ